MTNRETDSLGGHQAKVIHRRRQHPRLVDQRVRYGLICAVLPPVPAKVCELGVGGGWMIHQLYEQGYDVHGCDLDLDNLPSNSPLASRLLKASGSRLPFPDNHFDAAYSCDVLEHVFPNERQAFIAEIVRITKPGGVVAMTAFFRNTFTFRLWGVGHLLLRKTLPSWYTEHLTIPAPSEAKTFQQLQASLQEVRMVRYQRALNLFVMWLQCAGSQQRHLARFVDALGRLIPSCDLFGQTTSTFFTGVKR